MLLVAKSPTLYSTAAVESEQCNASFVRPIKLLTYLRASVCKYRIPGASCEIFNFFIFCLNKPFSELFLKIQLKVPKAHKFFQNRGKSENRHFGFLPPSKKG